jgi:hypothetical protein
VIRSIPIANRSCGHRFHDAVEKNLHDDFLPTQADFRGRFAHSRTSSAAVVKVALERAAHARKPHAARVFRIVEKCVAKSCATLNRSRCLTSNVAASRATSNVFVARVDVSLRREMFFDRVCSTADEVHERIVHFIEVATTHS